MRESPLAEHVHSVALQDELVQLGAIRQLYVLVMRPQSSLDMIAAATRALGALCEESEAAQLAVLGAGILPRVVAVAESDIATGGPAGFVAESERGCVCCGVCGLSLVRFGSCDETRSGE